MNSFSDLGLSDLMGQLQAGGILSNKMPLVAEEAAIEVTDNMLVQEEDLEPAPLEEETLSEEEVLLHRAEALDKNNIDVSLIRDLFNYIIVSQGRMSSALNDIKDMLQGRSNFTDYTGVSGSSNVTTVSAQPNQPQKFKITKELTPQQRHLIDIGAISIGDPDLVAGEEPGHRPLRPEDMLQDNPYTAAILDTVKAPGKMSDAERRDLFNKHLEESKRLAAKPPPFVKK